MNAELKPACSLRFDAAANDPMALGLSFEETLDPIWCPSAIRVGEDKICTAS
jgi:hypothetical protein